MTRSTFVDVALLPFEVPHVKTQILIENLLIIYHVSNSIFNHRLTATLVSGPVPGTTARPIVSTLPSAASR